MASGYKPKLTHFDTGLLLKDMRGRNGKILYPVKVIARDGETLPEPVIEQVDNASLTASYLRQTAPRSEQILWERLEQMGFRHSVPMFGYILDFYHPVARIAIEVDGAVHRKRKLKDRRRDRVLYKHGIRTHRFWAVRVYENADEVAMHVKNILTLATPVIGVEMTFPPHKIKSK